MGAHCLFHSKSNIGVEASIGNFVQIGQGAQISPNVTIEDEVFIGAKSRDRIRDHHWYGCANRAGSVVIATVGAGETVFGNPAAQLKK